MLFLAGVVLYDYVRVGGFLKTKEKFVHTTLCTTYVKKNRLKTPSTLELYIVLFLYWQLGRYWY
jgi:hypothetical protein